MKIVFTEKANFVRLIVGAVLLALGILIDYIQAKFLIPNSSFLIINYITFITAYIILGADIIYSALKNIIRGQVFDENFLMSIATIGAFVIGEAPEAVAVMLFFQVGEYFQERAVEKSKRSITDLMDIRPDYANLVKNGEVLKVAPDTVSAGDIIIVKPGEKIPLD